MSLDKKKVDWLVENQKVLGEAAIALDGTLQRIRGLMVRNEMILDVIRDEYLSFEKSPPETSTPTPVDLSVTRVNNTEFYPLHPTPRTDGYLPTTMNYLKMDSHPDPRRRLKTIRKSHGSWDWGSPLRVQEFQPNPQQWRYIYNQIGRPCLWYEKNLLTDLEIHKRVSGMDVYALVDQTGTHLGFAEVDFLTEQQAELTHFGLYPNVIGRGYEKEFLNAMVDIIWNENPKMHQLIVKTDDHDSEFALDTYKSAGFELYHTRRTNLIDPRVVWPQHMTKFEMSSYPWPKNMMYQKLIASGQIDV